MGPTMSLTTIETGVTTPRTEIGGIQAGISSFEPEKQREFGRFKIPEIPAFFQKFH